MKCEPQKCNLLINSTIACNLNSEQVMVLKLGVHEVSKDVHMAI